MKRIDSGIESVPKSLIFYFPADEKQQANMGFPDALYFLLTFVLNSLHII
jgi:hypothetical protein